MPTFLFDFDGTLADSLSTIVGITNRLAPEFGYRPTPLEQVDALKGLSTRQLIRYSGIPILKIPALLRRLRVELIAYSTHIEPFEGIPETIQHLHSQTHFLGIITSNTQEVVNPFLTTHSLDRCFINVVGGGTIFGKGRLLAKYVKRYGFSPDYTVYVGDEVRDIQAARFAGLRSAAVTWGFNSREALALAKPDWLVDEPQELTAIAAALSHQENKH